LNGLTTNRALNETILPISVNPLITWTIKYLSSDPTILNRH